MDTTCSTVEVWDDERNCGNIELMQEVAGRRMEVEWLSRYIFLALSTTDVEMSDEDDRYIHMAMKRMGDFQCDNLGGCTPSSCTWCRSG